MKLIILLALSCLTFISIGQNWEAQMLQPNANFYDIQAAFNAEWGTNEYERGKGYKQFKRWENFWETRIMPDGSFPSNHKEIWSSFINQLISPSVKSGGIGNWSPLGPFDHTNTDSWSAGTGRVNCIAEDPNNSSIIFVGTPAGGAWKSTDGGSTWAPISDELSVIGISAIAIDPSNSNIIYMATGDTDGGDTYSIGLVKSLDGGATWATIGGITANETSDILIDPSNPSVIWLATNVGLMKSTDSGNSFTNVLAQNIRDIDFKPGVYSTVYAVDANDFFVTTNGGTNWSNTTTGLPNALGRLAIGVTPANANYVYLMASETDWSFNGIYRSTNSGTSFTAQNTTTDIFESTQAWYDMAFGVSDTDEDILITGVLNVWKSTNGGSNFNQVNNWSSPGAASYTHADIHYIKYINGTLYCGSDGGIYTSSNDAGTFTDLSAGLQIGQFYRLGSSQNDVNTLAGGLQDNGGYAYVGGIWKNWYGADGMEAGVHPTNSNIIYGMIQYGDLYRSTNGGNTSGYVGQPEQGRWVTPMQMDQNGDRLLAGYNDLHEFDFTTGWNQLSTFNFPDQLRSIEIYDGNSDIIFVGTNYGIYRTTNNGANFTDITGTLSGVGQILTSIEVNPTDSDEIWVTYGGWNGSNHIFHTTNGGTNWTNITGVLPNLPCNIVKYDPSGAGGLYIGTDIGVYFRDNATGIWVEYNNNLPNVIVNDLEINYNANVIRAGTYGRGVWESGVYSISDYDIGISSISAPTDTYCNENSFDPVVTLTNYGNNTITTATITYDIDGGTALTYDWTGSLLTGESENITLPTMSASNGIHTFNAETSVPNGVADEESNNDANSSSFTVTLGAVLAYFNITPDCWGSEITWEILDSGGNPVITGGPYGDGTDGTLFTDEICIQPDCYDFTIYDGYGDGMYGSQYGSCTVDGTYNLEDSEGNILMELIAANADYGSSESNNFCITASLTADLTASSISICEGETIDFTDASTGTPIDWQWSFEGASPNTSTDQNPIGISYITAGTYDVELIVGDGSTADTILLVDYITVNAPSSGSETVVECDSYTWSANGTMYSNSGTFTATLVDVNGCDSIATLNLTINNSSSGIETISTCGNYLWNANGQTYTTSGSYTTTLTNAIGCDSVVTLDLTINTPNSGSESISNCNSYTWSANGQTYTSSGTYSTTLTNVDGCDSVATLNLTILTPTTSSISIENCDSYTWPENGMNYTNSGSYAHTILNNAGCDSVITLNLTINNSISTPEDVTACISYYWPATGMTYSSDGSYTANLTTVDGCDSIVTLNLTISTSASTSQTVNACDDYTWSANGMTYSTTGSYSTTLTSTTGCDSTVTLNLTINSPNSGSESVSACGNYTWSANGTNYTNSGTYTATLTNVDGCDSIATLNLTIDGTVYGPTTTVSNCGSYTWSENSNTYSNSGTYTTTLPSVNGCDSILTLELIINTPDNVDDFVTDCDSYYWSATGITYANSGTYSATLTNQAGCDSTVLLYLTINLSDSETLVTTECNEFYWDATNTTYSASGNYTATLTNENGCDSLVTLDLTILPENSITETVETCDEYQWDVNGMIYSNSGSYTETYSNQYGCDSIRTLDLTINTVDNSATQINDTTIQADASGITYQWLDCNNGYSEIDGETNQTFYASQNGDYAVQVTDGNCVDTSDCFIVDNIGLSEIDFITEYSIFPNPTQGDITIDFGDKLDEIELSLYDAQGKLVRSTSYFKTASIDFPLNVSKGMYVLKMTSLSSSVNVKLIKE